jgi:hypothetical protein
MNQGTGLVEGQLHRGAHRFPWYILFISFAIFIVILPVTAQTFPGNSTLQTANAPQVVYIGVYAGDFRHFNVEDGTFQTNFYLSLYTKNDNNISINDFAVTNGQITSVDTLINTPTEKYYRIYATLTADPDLGLYPFDRHILPIEVEPKRYNESQLVLVADSRMTGIDPGADLPGWQFGDIHSRIINETYDWHEESFSPQVFDRAVFEYEIQRNAVSTSLKFFLPMFLIIIVSLSSLMMKVSSRLGLNASMFLAAVLIHWRIADAIPLVAYATFLDIFMMITYATLVMVLISGILILKFTEAKDTVRVEQVNYWSLRTIPPVSITLYVLLFVSLTW